MSPDVLTLVVSLGLIIFLGLIILLRNPSKLSNVIFALFCTNIMLWSLFNYLSDHAASENMLFTRLTVVFGSLIATSLLCLSYVFPKKLKSSLRTRLIIVMNTAINTGLSMSPLYISDLRMSAAGAELIIGPLYLLFTVYMLALVVWAVINFIHQLRGARRIAKSQIKLFMFAFLVYGFFAIISNIILPLILDNWSSSRFGPIFIVPFVGITAYAIVKHRLFDIQTVVARILGYVITMAIIITLYSLIIAFVVAKLVSLDHLSGIQLVLLASPTVVSTMTFPYIKRWVDNLTAQIFYHNIYQIRDVLDRLSATLISENDLEHLTRGSIRVLNSALHPSAVYAAIIGAEGVTKEFTTNRKAPNNIDDLLALIIQHHGTVINRDYSERATIDDLLLAADADTMLRLENGGKFLGFILFSRKKSGSPYTVQDLNLLKVAGYNLSIAIDNAQKYDEITHFADTLRDEVERATEGLRRANERLKTLDKLKDDFLSMASHQFRTPAGSIRQAFKMIHDTNLTKKDRDEVLLLAEANSEQLVNVVNTMLNISRIEAGRFMIDRSLTDISSLIDRVISATQILADQKNITIKYDHPDKVITLEVDRAKVNEAMKNYLENAIKYSPNDSTVTITVREENEMLHYEVTDQGMGVPEPERKKLFGKFYRAENARQFQPDGNGIGLYVVKEIAQGHGGEVYYRPIEPTGSLFGFSLPMNKHHHSN